MAAAKRKPAKAKGAPKKSLHGRMPTKRSINLILIDENKISVWKAIPAILAIVVLAALFSKYLVADRLIAMSQASARVSGLQSNLRQVQEAIEEYGEVEQTYAHYTYAGMTNAELNLVDRTLVLELVDSILPEIDPGPSDDEIDAILNSLFRTPPYSGDEKLDEARRAARLKLMEQLVPIPEYVINRWNVSDNLLTIEVNGQTLERLNLLGQQIEQSRIVDSSTLLTANKKNPDQTQDSVWGRFIVYLQQPPEAPEEAPAEEEVAQP